MESSSKEIETFFYPTQLAVFQKAKKQIEVKLIFCADEKKNISKTENEITVVNG